MNKKILGIPVSIVLAYLLIYFFPVAWTAAFAAIPLFGLKAKNAAITGFAVGLIVAVSFYLLYPLAMVGRLAGILANIIGMDSLILVFIFPLMYAVIMALSATVFSGIAGRYKKAE